MNGSNVFLRLSEKKSQHKPHSIQVNPMIFETSNNPTKYRSITSQTKLRLDEIRKDEGIFKRDDVSPKKKTGKPCAIIKFCTSYIVL
jgi:hypothetical protein